MLVEKKIIIKKKEHGEKKIGERKLVQNYSEVCDKERLMP